jgi:hypothetical protein
MAEPAAPLLDAFDDLLEHERRLLAAGDLHGLARLAELKPSLLARVAGAAPDAPALERLRGGLERNAALLRAAGQGVRDALDRMRSLLGPAPPLSTYDGQGRRNQLAQGSPSVSRNV